MVREKRLLAGGCILVLVVLFVCVIPVLLSTVFCPQDTEIAAELERRYGMAFTVQDSARLTWSEARQAGFSGFLGGRRYQVCPTGEPETSFQVTEAYHGQSISTGTWSIIDLQTGNVCLQYPFLTPYTQALSFAQAYQILQALDWKGLTGSEAEFSFVGRTGAPTHSPIRSGRGRTERWSAAAPGTARLWTNHSGRSMALCPTPSLQS